MRRARRWRFRSVSREMSAVGARLWYLISRKSEFSARTIDNHVWQDMEAKEGGRLTVRKK